MIVTKLIKTLLEITETYKLDPSKVEVVFNNSNFYPVQEILSMEFNDILDPD